MILILILLQLMVMMITMMMMMKREKEIQSSECVCIYMFNKINDVYMCVFNTCIFNLHDPTYMSQEMEMRKPCPPVAET